MWVSSISRLTFKEAFDSIPEGILFSQNGQIVLINKVMIDLVKLITGVEITDSQKFWGYLLHNQNNDFIKKMIFGEQIIVRTSDGKAWTFTKDLIKAGKRSYIQIIAADMTEVDMFFRQLESNIKCVNKKREDLLYMIDNVESTMREKELTLMKYRVHDVFGYQLSIINQLLSSPKESLAFNELEKFVDNWPNEIRADGLADPEELLENLITSLDNIGIAIAVNAKLPTNKQTAFLLYKIIKEATINAVRHGGATQIDVKIRYQIGNVSMTISNNGELLPDHIVEGGGIGSMRYWICEAGGSLSITNIEKFCIYVDLPM